MCTRITCRRCGKPDWTGCGAHVEQVMRGVPPDQRCACGADRPTGGGLLGWLTGRR